MRRLEQQQQMERNKEELVSVKSSNSNVGNKLEEQKQHMRNIEQELANARSYLNNCANQASELIKINLSSGLKKDNCLQRSAAWKLRGPSGRLPAFPLPMGPEWLHSKVKLTKLLPGVFSSKSLLDPLALRYCCLELLIKF